MSDVPDAPWVGDYYDEYFNRAYCVAETEEEEEEE